MTGHGEPSLVIKNAKGKLAKEVTKNQRIVYLLEKYEKRVVNNPESDEEEKERNGVLEEAEAYIEDFTESRVDLVPNVEGTILYHKGDGNIKRQRHMVLAIRPSSFEVLIATCKESVAQGKAVERLDLRTEVMSMYSSFRREFHKRG